MGDVATSLMNQCIRLKEQHQTVVLFTALWGKKKKKKVKVQSLNKHNLMFKHSIIERKSTVHSIESSNIHICSKTKHRWKNWTEGPKIISFKSYSDTETLPGLQHTDI